MGFKPWRFLPPKVSHALVPLGIRLGSYLGRHEQLIWNPKELLGLKFSNPLGVAAGLDKDARWVKELYRLGFGFLEVGTVTPQPQGPNPGPILDRFWSKKTLWNRMGFPSRGVKSLAQQLERLDPKDKLGPLFVNVGKNRHTLQAEEDFKEVIRVLDPWADAFILNLSSPNTPGLRSLQTPEFLHVCIPRLRAVTQKPLGIKLSPDLSFEALEELLKTVHELGIEIVTLTNTTLSRPPGFEHIGPEGGLSGLALKELSLAFLKKASEFKHKHQAQYILISVGGIMSPSDIKERLALGADLVQVYSVLAFEGFHFPRNVAKCWSAQ